MDPKARRTVDKDSHEEGELSPGNDELLNNGHDTQAKLSKPAKQQSYSDDSNQNRFHLLALLVSNFKSCDVNFALI